MRGNITRRGKTSWRFKFDVGTDPATGKRLVRTVTVRGKRQDAEKELSRLANAAHDGTLVEPSKITVADYLRSWLNGTHGLSGKTVERYQQLAEQQIIPHLGSVACKSSSRPMSLIGTGRCSGQGERTGARSAPHSWARPPRPAPGIAAGD